MSSAVPFYMQQPLSKSTPSRITVQVCENLCFTSNQTYSIPKEVSVGYRRPPRMIRAAVIRRIPLFMKGLYAGWLTCVSRVNVVLNFTGGSKCPYNLMLVRSCQVEIGVATKWWATFKRAYMDFHSEYMQYGGFSFYSKIKLILLFSACVYRLKLSKYCCSCK